MFEVRGAQNAGYAMGGAEGVGRCVPIETGDQRTAAGQSPRRRGAVYTETCDTDANQTRSIM
jgi:hypothetical protein